MAMQQEQRKWRVVEVVRSRRAKGSRKVVALRIGTVVVEVGTVAGIGVVKPVANRVVAVALVTAVGRVFRRRWVGFVVLLEVQHRGS